MVMDFKLRLRHLSLQAQAGFSTPYASRFGSLSLERNTDVLLQAMARTRRDGRTVLMRPPPMRLGGSA